MTATNSESAVLGPLLERLRNDAAMRIAMAQAAASIAKTEFDPTRIRAEFANLLRQARSDTPAMIEE